ncbi:hypothetical protein PST407_01374 [Pseudomonas syringae pv. tomato]|uniref:DUF1534 domain-containing protein n=1 Tax=Pseudomonas syringae pv. tomato TaxID=323 RepID=A0AAV1BTD0_PSEUB|nr:hypothetical protein PSTA9_05457 [Pseudomonas syringae pv. tomato]KUR50472.1 hypothetical protein PST407_01374 [Pseudomonas syringae pv. tomato]CAI9000290.1 hypothetical protein DAPPPG215_28675 [Pseudomonas syringae pv. tomato]
MHPVTLCVTNLRSAAHSRPGAERPERHYHAERSNDDRAQCINRRSAALRGSTGSPPSFSTA